MGGGASKASESVRANKIYYFEEALGEGSFAVVYKAKLLETGRTNADGVKIPEYVAIKAIDKTKLPSSDIPLLQEECQIMGKLHHPNCVALLEYFDEPEYFYLVLELVEGGELFESIVNKGFYSEVEAAHAIRQISLALSFLEENRIVHRDVKPENLIYESHNIDANIKLTDFGLAKDISGQQDENPLTESCGTPGYVAPEVLLGKKYGVKVDSWAIGVILFILLCGYPPFYAEDQKQMFSLIKKGKFSFRSPYWDEVSDDAKQLVCQLLEVDPAKRLSAKQVLEHPWAKDPEAQKSTHLGNHVIEGLEKIRKEKLQRAYFKIRAMKSFDMIARASKRFDEVVKKSTDNALEVVISADDSEHQYLEAAIHLGEEKSGLHDEDENNESEPKNDEVSIMPADQLDHVEEPKQSISTSTKPDGLNSEEA